MSTAEIAPFLDSQTTTVGVEYESEDGSIERSVRIDILRCDPLFAVMSSRGQDISTEYIQKRQDFDEGEIGEAEFIEWLTREGDFDAKYHNLADFDIIDLPGVWAPALDAPLRESDHVVVGDATDYEYPVNGDWDVVGYGRYVLRLRYFNVSYDARHGNQNIIDNQLHVRLGYDSADEAYDAAKGWIDTTWRDMIKPLDVGYGIEKDEYTEVI